MVPCRRYTQAVFPMLLAAMMAGCGGGGGGGSSLPANGSGNLGGSATPSSFTTSGTFSTSSATSVTLSKIASGVSGSITLPTGSAAATANLTFESSLPSGVSTPASIQNKKTAQSIGGSNLTLLAVVAMTVTSSVTVASSPAFSFTVPNAISGDAYIAYFDVNDSAAGWNVLLGPGSASGTTISFPAQPITPPITFVPNDVYVFALVVSSTPANTASLNYTGAKSTTFQYNFSFGYPTAPPTPLPTTIAATTTVAVTVGASPYPTVTATPALVNLHVAESDAGTLATSTFTTDSWVGVSSATTPYSVQTYATVQREPSSATLPVFTTIYGTPQTTDQMPQSGGASWSNVPTATISYSYSDATNGTRTVGASGNYSDTEQLLGGAGGQLVMTENSDGSGSITGPFLGGAFVNELQFSTPSGNPAMVTISLDFTQFAQQNFGDPPSESISEPLWYNVPLALYSESDTITANAPLPGTCTPNSYGTSANDVRRSIVTVDTLVGVIETTVFDSYEVNGQPICLITSDTQSYAYDEQGNTPSVLIYVGSLGVEVVTTTESLILQPGSALVQSSMRATPASVSAASISPAIAALESHQLSRLAHDRAIRTHAFLASLRSARPSLQSVHGVQR